MLFEQAIVWVASAYNTGSTQQCSNCYTLTVRALGSTKQYLQDHITCRRDAAEATHKRLEDAAKLKAQEERDKAAQKHQRQDYK